DTLATSYAYDNQPWLSSMERLGFSVATRSHSNYDVTVLTLASMFNGAQIPTLIPSPPDSRAAQFRALTRIINQGTDLQRFRHAGYEIVSVPSEYFEGTVVDADRNLDTGELSSFEMQLLQTGAMTTAFGDLEETVRAIQDRGATTPVIVIFSDHGTRFWSDNRPEMFHSLLLAATPGHPGLFLDDASPVNLLSRLLNAYTTIQVPLSSEEDYWL